MDISMVLNSTEEEHQTTSPKVTEWNEKSQWQPQQPYPLPPMRTQPPTTRHSFDGARTDGMILCCLDCFGGNSRSQYRSPGHNNDFQPAAAGYRPLPSMEANGQGYMKHPEAHGDLRLPPVSALNSQQPNNEAWNATNVNSTQLEDVRLNPKRSPRRASASPIIGRHSHPHRSPSHIARRSPQPLTRPYPVRAQSEEVAMYVAKPNRNPQEAMYAGNINRHPQDTIYVVDRTRNPQETMYVTEPNRNPQEVMYVGDLNRRPQETIYVVDLNHDPQETMSRGSCNRPYNIAQIDWIRYTKVDCSLSYESMSKPFDLLWPGESKTGHCFSARFYRDNWIPRVDANNNPVADDKGRLILDPAKMRDIKSAEGREKCVPYSLVERYPWRALEYGWVSEEHKELARAIMRGEDPNDPTGKKAKWREALWKIETFKYREYI